MKKRSILAVLFSAALCLNILSGCTGNQSAATATDTTVQDTTQPQSEEAQGKPIVIEITSDADRIYDTAEYSFTPDPDAVGEWEAVDCIKKIDDYDPDILEYPDISQALYQGNSILDNGSVYVRFSTHIEKQRWTKSYIFMSEISMTPSVIPEYKIQKINNDNYMFLQWKSGDYINRGQINCYYVFKKTSDTPEIPDIYN